MERIKAPGMDERARERGCERMTPESKVQLFPLFCASGSKNRLHIEKKEEGNGLGETLVAEEEKERQSVGVCGHVLT